MIQYNDRAMVATDRRLLLLEPNFLGRARGLVSEAPSQMSKQSHNSQRQLNEDGGEQND